MPDIEVIEVLVPGLQGPAVALAGASTTELTVGGGSKMLSVTPTSVAIAEGMRVRIVNGDASKIMDGEVSAWDEEGGELTVVVDYTEGSGTDDDWMVICNAGPPGPAAEFDGDASDIPTTEGGTFGGDDVETVLDAHETALAGKQPLDADLTAIAGLSPSNDDVLQRKSGAWTNRTPAELVEDLPLPEELCVVFSDETTAIEEGTAKAIFRMPWAGTLSAVKASLGVAQASGDIFTVDVNKNGSSVLSTKLTIDNAEKTSLTAATPPVIDTPSFAADDEVSIDVDQVGDGSAKGGKVWLYFTRS